MIRKYRKDGLIKSAYADVLKKIHTSKFMDKDYSVLLQRYRAFSLIKNSGVFYDMFGKSRNELFAHIRKPLVGYLCNLVPEELIIAAGAIPVRLCSMDPAFAQAGEEIIPGDICPLVKSVCGAIACDFFEKLDLIVIPAACDGKIKLAELLSPFKQIYFLDIPKDTNYLDNADIWVEKFTRFYDFLKDRYRADATRKGLFSLCSLLNRRTSVFRKIYEFRAKNAGIINSFDYFIMSYASFFLEPGEWTAAAEKVYEEAKSRGASSFAGKRLLLAGAPIIFPNFKILEIIHEAGCDVSADLLCSAYGRLFNPVDIDEETENGIIRALSLKYISATICPCFIGMDKIINGIIDTVKEYKLDGVLYHNLRLCQGYDIQTVPLRQILKENGIPFLSIKTDLGAEDKGQIKTRVEAYLEMMKKR